MRVHVEHKNYEGIPYTEYFLRDHVPKGLVFVQHGYTSDKVDGAEWFAMKIVRENYHVICIDAYKHGDRIEEPFISYPEDKKILGLFEVVPQTAKDIITLFEGVYSGYEKFDYIGISMGGMIGFMLITLTDKVRKVVPVIGSPYHYDYMRVLDWFDDRSHIDAYMDENKDELLKCDPKNNVDKMKYDAMFILYGDKDGVVPGHYNQAFYDEHKNDRMKIQMYDAGHETTEEMQKDIIEFINEEMAD